MRASFPDAVADSHLDNSVMPRSRARSSTRRAAPEQAAAHALSNQHRPSRLAPRAGAPADAISVRPVAPLCCRCVLADPTLPFACCCTHGGWQRECQPWRTVSASWLVLAAAHSATHHWATSPRAQVMHSATTACPPCPVLVRTIGNLVAPTCALHAPCAHRGQFCHMLACAEMSPQMAISRGEATVTTFPAYAARLSPRHPKPRCNTGGHKRGCH